MTGECNIFTGTKNRTMKKLLFIVLVAFVTSAKAQYTVTSIPYNPPVAYNTGTSAGVHADDQWSQVITLPFAFKFFGHTYTKIVIGSNELISFDTVANVPGSYCPWPLTSGTPLPTSTFAVCSIMGPGQDIDPTNSGSITWQVIGTAPFRMFVVSYDSVPYYGSANSVDAGICPTPPLTATSQIVLYETTNMIDVYIQDKPDCSGWNDGYAIEGIQNDSGTIAAVVPGRNNTVWTTTNDAWRFSMGLSVNIVNIVNSDCSLNNGSITTNVVNGIPPYTFYWNSTPPQTVQNLTNVAPGNYCVTVIDSVGDTASVCGTVNYTSPNIAIINVVDTTCGISGGSMAASVTGGASPYHYVWNSTPPQSSQTLTNVAPGYYCVTATDANGCQATACDSIGAIAYAAPDICMVSVDTATNHNKVIWEKPAVANGIAKYYIFRESAVAGIYNLIGVQDYSVYSTFVDSTSNSLQQSYRYELAINDSCGNTSPLSNYHQTIHLSINAGMGGSWNLIWNDYIGFTFSTYAIFRGTNPGNLSVLDSVSSSVTSYTDLTPPPGILYYLVEAVNPSTCYPSKPRGDFSFSSPISNIANPAFTGINDGGTNYGIQVYPNPATDELTIIAPQNATIDILNVEGQLIKTFALSGNKTCVQANVDISTFICGVYIVEVKTEKGIATRKFIKE